MNQLKIENKYPPNIEDIKRVLTLHPGILFTFGDVIYNPNNSPVNEHVYIHELQHQKQQDGHPQEWWTKYLADKEFRAYQELEAYKVQYGFVKEVIKDRNALWKFRHAFATALSGEMYGKVYSYGEALKALNV